MDDLFAQRLREIREASGRSLRELERKIHVSNSSLSRYLSGQPLPPWPVVVALCQVARADPRPLRGRAHFLPFVKVFAAQVFWRLAWAMMGLAVAGAILALTIDPTAAHWTAR